jgi:hypothetical protein
MKSHPSSARARRLFFAALITLAVLHHDFWLWNNDRLLFGFLPVGLAYHIGFSMAAAALWLAAIRVAWPHELEAWSMDITNDE